MHCHEGRVGSETHSKGYESVEKTRNLLERLLSTKHLAKLFRRGSLRVSHLSAKMFWGGGGGMHC